ncbi:hypothetical protein N9U50_01915 [Candidatus Pelagibacter sp.]|nr:hypothetical protein [Candidatus Pelagibacter sp.]
MAKIRKTASIENGLMEVLKILNDEEVQAAIGKSTSYLRKCSNPDLPQQIDHNDSFLLDKACIEKGKAPPLLTSHEFMIAKEFDKVETAAAKDISQILVRSTILHGKLTELIHNAQDPKSDRGETISVLEKKEINEAITDLENKIMKIKMTIDTKF